MKIYNGQAGQFGDAIMSLKVSEHLHSLYPKDELVSGISFKYQSLLPILSTIPYINQWIIWEGYCDTFPTQFDRNVIKANLFDIFFNPMSGNHKSDWYKDTHQVADMFLRNDLRPPEDLQINLPPTVVREDLKNAVAFAPFPNNGIGSKCLNVNKAQIIVDHLKMHDMEVIQLGSIFEPVLKKSYKPRTNWLDTAVILNSVKFLITADTAVSWLGSAYKAKTIGLYGYEGYYNGIETSKNWQPVNPNAHYLEAPNCNDIPNEKIFELIDKMRSS